MKNKKGFLSIVFFLFLSISLVYAESVDGIFPSIVTQDTIRRGDSISEIITIYKLGRFQYKEDRKTPFRGHWMGLEFGFNSYHTPGAPFSMNFSDENKNMELSYAKSGSIGWNVVQFSFGFNRHFGFVTGLGFLFNSYRFDNTAVVAEKQDGKLTFFEDTLSGNDYYFSKITAAYFRIPILFEYTSHPRQFANFHVSLGVIPGICMGGWTRQKYEYFDSSNKGSNKQYSDLYLNVFRLEAVAYIGVGPVGLYFSYTPTSLFQKNKAAEVFPYSFGIVLTMY